MSGEDLKILYRAIAQSNGITITAETMKGMTEEEAKASFEKNVFPNSPYVMLPICTEKQWKYGQINFCPRCGKNICQEVGGDFHGGVTDILDFECPECYAAVYVHIKRTTEQNRGPRRG
ncbi:hypothetical protein [Paenibacillus tyrfis]|uniref:hypothetical protein n=1 Tax=Paenibacillus tyrfis TaxID=1501230 RepID=UPI000B58F128|nr:hypothetical protein [Paenibacillus tyrfis]